MIESKNYKDTLKKVFKWVFIGLIFFLLYFPIIIIMVLSVNKSQTGSTWTGFTLKWYAEIFKVRTLYTSILNSILVAMYSTLIATVVGIFTSIGINALTKKKKKAMMLFNNIPMLNSEIVTGISVMLIFVALLPLFPNIFGFTTMLVAHIFFTLPYVILSILPKLRECDENLYEAAQDLGCPPYKALIKVIIPAIKTGIFTGALLAFTMSIDDFVISYFTGGNGFTNFSNWIYARLGRRNFSPAAYAYNALLTIVVLSSVLIANLKRGKKVKTN